MEYACVMIERRDSLFVLANEPCAYLYPRNDSVKCDALNRRGRLELGLQVPPKLVELGFFGVGNYFFIAHRGVS